MRDKHRSGMQAQPLVRYGIPASDTIAPAGKCELCGRHTPMTQHPARMYKRFCCPRHETLARARVKVGKPLDGRYVDKRVVRR